MIKGITFGLFREALNTIKARDEVTDYDYNDRLNKEISPISYPIYCRLRHIRRVQEFPNLSFQFNNNEALEGVFKALDTDGSGELSYNEFQTGFDSLGFNLSDDESREIFRRFETSRNKQINTIEYKEFVDYIYGKPQKVLMESIMKITFTLKKQGTKYIRAYLTDISSNNPIRFKEFLSKCNINTTPSNVSRLLYFCNSDADTFISLISLDRNEKSQVFESSGAIENELLNALRNTISDVFDESQIENLWQKVCVNYDNLLKTYDGEGKANIPTIMTDISKRELPYQLFIISLLRSLKFDDDAETQKIINIDDYDEIVKNSKDVKNEIGSILLKYRFIFLKNCLNSITVSYFEFRSIITNPFVYLLI